MRRTVKYARVAGVEFSGDTVSDAKAKGELAIQTFVRESNNGPSVYRVGALTVLVWPQIEGWAYRILLDTDKGGYVAPMCNMGGTRSDAVASAVSHAAMWQFNPSEPNHGGFADHNYLVSAFWPARKDAADGFAAALDKAFANCADQIAWQRRYMAAMDVCGDRNWSHDVACRTRTVDEARELATRESKVAA